MKNDIILKILDNLNKVILGKQKTLENVLIALLAKGHLLIEDIPGVGKTTLVKALAKSIDLSYKRVQFTPDLMPSDIIGINIFNKDEGGFQFKKGPIFHQIFLADEINRTSPKTQSSLLQAMEEGEVSTEDNHYVLDKPFMVLATQNPLEYQGTFPLPEAQLDRFIMKISLGYPDKRNEISILKNSDIIRNISDIYPVATKTDIQDIQDEVSNLAAHDDILDYIIDIANKTRTCNDLKLGASPRASIDLLKASRARAYLHGRNYVIPDDVKEMVVPVLNHRIIISPEARMERRTTEEILQEIINKIRCK